MNKNKYNLPDFRGQPVVALETTIISHGMPYPQNVETGLAVEEEIRRAGAIPATIGIVDGQIKIGMTRDEIESFGQRHDIVKCSRRDIGYVLANKMSGATTVAATMMLAELAGISVFATGGIGGVHRGAETSMDISADLEEFSKSPVNVVCAGPKAILDVGLTLEYLETKGVPVLVYNSETVPLFFTRSSSYRSPIVVRDPKEIADIISINEDLGFHQASLICNPIPEEHSLDGQYIEEEIQSALKEMDKLGIKGKEVTPFLLQKIVALTGGRSLAANIALIRSNARLAGQIAVELAKNCQ